MVTARSSCFLRSIILSSPALRGDDIRSALFKLPDLRQENDHFWNWIRPQDANRVEHTSGVKEDVYTFTTTLDNGSIVLGTLELREKELVLETNSQRRAECGRAILQPVIEGLVREPLIKIHYARSTPTIEVLETAADIFTRTVARRKAQNRPCRARPALRSHPGEPRAHVGKHQAVRGCEDSRGS